MPSEHDLGREHVQGIHALLDAGSVAQALPVVRSYQSLLESHIRKENDMLFPMADRLLDEARVAEMNLGFDHSECECAGEKGR